MTLIGHPLHPFTVHFPIVLYLLGVLLTAVYLWRGQPDAERFAYWTFGVSWIATVIASIFGLIDQGQLDPSDPRLAAVNSHVTAGVALLVINGLLLYMRFRWPDVLSRHRWPYLGLMAAGVISVLSAGWLGAELVYRWQIGIIQ